jgi:hypothetical protein
MCVADLCFRVRFFSLGHRTYTGTGGYGDDNRFGGNNNSWGSRIQVEDQSFDHKDNNALRVRSHSLAGGPYLSVLQVSWKRSRPVRVIRGSALRSRYAPHNGFRYDGLYKVIDVIIPCLLCLAEPALTPENRRTWRNPKVGFTRSAASNWSYVSCSLSLGLRFGTDQPRDRESQINYLSPLGGTNSPQDAVVISNMSWRHAPPMYIIPNVLEWNEQIVRSKNAYHSLFHLSHRLLLRQSVCELLKLGDDRAVGLRPGRDVPLLIVARELGDASLGGLCWDLFRRSWLDSERWIELDVRHFVRVRAV